MRRALFQCDFEVSIKRCAAHIESRKSGIGMQPASAGPASLVHFHNSHPQLTVTTCAGSRRRSQTANPAGPDTLMRNQSLARSFRRNGQPWSPWQPVEKQPAGAPFGGLPAAIACHLVHSRAADAAPGRRPSGYTPPARWEKRSRTFGSLPKAQFARNRSGLIPPRVHHSGEIGRPPQKCRAASTPKGQEAQRRERPSPRDLRYVLPNSQAKEQRGERGFGSAQAVSPRAPAGLRRWAGTPSLRQMTPAHVPDSGFRDPSRRLAA